MPNLRQKFKSTVHLVNPIKEDKPALSNINGDSDDVPLLSYKPRTPYPLGATAYDLAASRRGVKGLFSREASINAVLRAGQPSTDHEMDHYVLSVKLKDGKAIDLYSVNVYSDRIDVRRYGTGSTLSFPDTDFKARMNFNSWLSDKHFTLPASDTQANGSRYGLGLSRASRGRW